MSFEESLSRTIHQIYAAAADPSLWPSALHEMEELTGADGVVIDFAPRRPPATPITYAGRFTAEQCETYSREYMSICRRVAFAIAHPEIPIAYDDMILSEAEMDRDPVYAWLQEMGLRYHVGCRIGETLDHYVFCSFQRSAKMGHAQRRDLEVAALLQRHLTQAIALSDRLGLLHERHSLHEQLVDQVPRPIFVTDVVGRILLSNRAANVLLRSEDGIFSRGHALHCLDHEADVELGRHLAKVADPVAPEGGWLRVPRSSGKLAFSVLIAPLITTRKLGEEGQVRAAVIVHDPEQRFIADKAALKHVYGLTNAEANVARALAVGHTVASAASHLGVSEETVRTHLKAVFHKLEVGRQQDLLRILAALSGTWELSPPNG